MKILITGSNGFIGSHLVKRLSNNPDHFIIGIDSMEPAYGPSLNNARMDWKETNSNVLNRKVDISKQIPELGINYKEIDVIIHLAAWPGVRQSEINKSSYYKNNIVAFGNVLDLVEKCNPDKFFFASSSSIYGDKGLAGAVRETDADGSNLKSYYAATKWANEIMAKAFSKNVNSSVIALRFFTVFGAYGRPDMAYWSFAKKLLEGERIDLYGKDGGERNFTGINNLVEIIEELLLNEKLKSGFDSLNIAFGEPIKTSTFLALIAKHLNVEEYKTRNIERPKVDVEKTWANLEKLNSFIVKKERYTLDEEVRMFCNWYKNFVNHESKLL